MHIPEPDKLAVDFTLPEKGWIDTPVNFREGTFSYPGVAKNLTYLGLPNPRTWAVTDEDWKLPENWKEIVINGMKKRLEKFRSFRLFMDICVRCGACADKCHFFLGSGDPKNMPVLRAELMRSIYRNDFTTIGKMLGRFAGARELTIDVIKEWFYYFFQCTECRRCSVFCPYGIDTAEVTMIGRELLAELGLTINWIIEPAANCFRTGNHLGLRPHTLIDTWQFIAEDVETTTGITIDVDRHVNRRGAEILFVTPSGDFFDERGNFTTMGYMLLFEHLGLDYTWSTYASEGGNFGSFYSNELMKSLNNKIYHEAKRLGVKWVLGGECGHMWRVLHQFMDTMNGPPDFLEEPVSPITGTKFENAKSTKMVHIVEFTADAIKNGKLKLDPSRNDNYIPTFHDSCNPARGMGFFEEPRYVINNVCNQFYEMPENTIREETFCCGAGAGLGNDENLDMRMRGAMPRATALGHVKEKHGVNHLLCVCAIDRATLHALTEYWHPDVNVGGVHEMVGNALIMDGEIERTTDLRGEPLPGMEREEDDE